MSKQGWKLVKPSGRDEFPISSRLLGDNHGGGDDDDDDVDVGDGNDYEDYDDYDDNSLSNQLSTAWWS